MQLQLLTQYFHNNEQELEPKKKNLKSSTQKIQGIAIAVWNRLQPYLHTLSLLSRFNR